MYQLKKSNISKVFFFFLIFEFKSNRLLKKELGQKKKKKKEGIRRENQHPIKVTYMHIHIHIKDNEMINKKYIWKNI